MKKFLYIAPVIVDLENSTGVAKKVLAHYKVFSKYYYSEMVSYGPNCLYFFKDDVIETIGLNNLNRRLRLYLFLKVLSFKNEKYDFIYIRYHLSDYLFIYILKLLKKTKAKIVVEIPTYPYKQELIKRNKFIKWFIDLTSRSLIKLYVDRIVTYSNHTRIFNIKTITTTNGIIFDDIIKSLRKNHLKNDINLISVSQTLPCNGYDRIIEGLYIYYKNGGEINLKYHLVGDGDEIIQYKKLIKKYNLDNHVTLYGFKGGQELDKIYNRADIAINSIAIHRLGLKNESTLKSREYSAKGLPIISSYEIDAFTKEDNNKYVLRVSEDDKPVNIETIIQFYNKIYSDNTVNISDEIRNSSQKVSDMDITLKGVIKYFN